MAIVEPISLLTELCKKYLIFVRCCLESFPSALVLPTWSPFSKVASVCETKLIMSKLLLVTTMLYIYYSWCVMNDDWSNKRLIPNNYIQHTWPLVGQQLVIRCSYLEGNFSS